MIIKRKLIQKDFSGRRNITARVIKSMRKHLQKIRTIREKIKEYGDS